MTLNRRHKAILFVTLVATGCALLAGAGLKEALGFMMLGVALAWAIGSEAASRLHCGLKGVSGNFYSWIRLPLAMALAGGLLGVVLLRSLANPVLVVMSMCAAGIFLAPMTLLPTKKIWLRVPLILLAGTAFILALVGMISTDVISYNGYGERFGQLAATGFVALLLGIFWLSKGWRLIGKGISAPASSETTVLAGARKRTWGQYISLFAGVIVLTLWLSLLAWLASSVWAYAPDKPTVTKGNNLLAQVAFIALLASWPYRSWKITLSRESNSEPKYLRRHRRTTAIAGMIFVVALSLAVTYGIQNGKDQLIAERITVADRDLTAVETKIAAIKQRDLQTTGDYIQAYSEVETLLPEFESKIQECADVYGQARQMDQSRGLINTRVFYKDNNPEMWRKDYEILDLLRQLDSLKKREALTVRNMATLPTSDQVDFWKKEFKPLVAQEDELREKIQTLVAKFQSPTK